MDLEKMTALELAEKIKQRQISVLDGVKTVFSEIEKKESRIHAYLDLYKKDAYARAKQVEKGKLKAKDITEDMISDHLYTAGLPDPDLIIRPSGEYRLSNFLLWQSAYAEFWYSDILWPDFTEADFVEALRAYEHRNRRFGGV